MKCTIGRSPGALTGRRARIAGLCCLILLAALMPVAQAEVAPQEADVSLGYGCQLAPGPRQVSIRVHATFPGAGVVGQPIQPQDVTVRVTFPPAAVADLTEQGVATVAGAIDLATTVDQNGKSSDSAWTGLAAPSTPLPKTGDLTLVASGPVPPVTVTAPGDVRFSAGLLGITLTPKKADGSATDPPTVPLACTLNPGEAAHLVSVPVSEGSAPKAAGTASNAAETTSPRADRVDGIITGPGANGQQQVGASFYEDINIPVIEQCLDGFGTNVGNIQAYVAGYANAKKLNGALVAGYPFPALIKGTGQDPEGLRPLRGLQANPVTAIVDGTAYLCNPFKVDLDYQGRMELPPARATFLAFGFMPVTATAHISQADDEPLTGTQYVTEVPPPGLNSNSNPYDIFTMAKVSLRLSDVTVNGVPLDVGANCRTTEHLTSPESPYRKDRLVLVGGSRANSPRPKFAKIFDAGATAGSVSIPNFTGCVTPSGEDLTSLLNATVSGPGNFMKMTIGPVCDSSILENCISSTDFAPNTVPYVNVSNGGTYNSTGQVVFQAGQNRNAFTIKCSSVVASGAIPDASGPPRGDLGTLSLTFPEECIGSHANPLQQDDSRWQVSMQGIAHLAAIKYNADTRQLTGKITDLSLRFTGTNLRNSAPPCTAVVGGSNRLTYTNPPDALLHLQGGSAEGVGSGVISDNCPGNYFRTNPTADPLNFSMRSPEGGGFDLDPANITITSPHPSEVVGP